MILYYVHDPMCSWCWGFRPIWAEIKSKLPEHVQVKYLLGGLAPDSSEPMPKSMQADIAGYWKRIQQHIPGTKFNYDFWNKCEPRRSTYPSCRAVIAARNQQAEMEAEMIKAIQIAYYLEAKNPSDDDTLVTIAETLGLDVTQFLNDLNHIDTQQQLEAEMLLGRQIGAQGFPSLVLVSHNKAQYVPVNYNNADTVLSTVNSMT